MGSPTAGVDSAMLCEVCKKKQATVHLTEIHNNDKREMHICEVCAREKGIPQKIHFSIPEILSGIVDSQLGKSGAGEIASLKCPQCGMNYADFRTKARFGCARDYEIFRSGIIPLVEKIHGSIRHTGKTPPGVEESLKRDNEILRLKADLERTIKSEDYEKAALIRDKIKSYETQGSSNEPQ